MGQDPKHGRELKVGGRDSPKHRGSQRNGLVGWFQSEAKMRPAILGLPWVGIPLKGVEPHSGWLWDSNGGGSSSLFRVLPRRTLETMTALLGSAAESAASPAVLFGGRASLGYHCEGGFKGTTWTQPLFKRCLGSHLKLLAFVHCPVLTLKKHIEPSPCPNRVPKSGLTMIHWNSGIPK